MTVDDDTRTPERPMAFSRAEFSLGAVASWIAFMILLVAALVVTAVQQSGLPWGPPLSMIALYLMFGIPIGGAVSAVVTLVASPVARAIAHRLVKTRRISVHLAAYAAFGAALGLVVLIIGVLLSQGDFASTFSTPMPWTVAGLCALAVASGWAWTVRHVTRPPRPPHPDAIAEDALWGDATATLDESS